MRIWALDDITRIDEVRTYEDIEVVERDCDTGSWKITLPYVGDGGLVSRWLNAPLPGIEVADPNTDFRFGGFMTRYRVDYDGKRRVATLEGRDFQSLVWDRLVWPQYTNLSRFWDHPTETLPLTTAVFYLADRNFHFSAEARRRIAHLEFGPDPGVGGLITFTSEGQVVGDLFKEWLTGTGYTFRLRFKREMTGLWENSGLVFECGARPATELVLNNSNLSTWTLEQTAAEATRVIAMGATWKAGVDGEKARLGLGKDDPDPPVKYVSEASHVEIGTTWRARYVETLISKSSSADDKTPTSTIITALAQEAATEVKAKDSKMSIQIEGVDASRIGYGRNLHIGWYVPVAPLSTDYTTLNPTYQLVPVSEFKWTRSADGETKTINLGTSSKVSNPAEMVFGGIRQAMERIKAITRLVPRYL